MIDNIKDVWDTEVKKVCYNICRSHHERYDGMGYPDGLKGEDIPIEAQIVSLADAFDNLVNESLSQAAMDFEDAFYAIVSGECGMFSPKLIECFRLVKEDIKNVK